MGAVESSQVQFLGRGPAATGSGAGWHMRSDLFGRCPRCRDFMSLRPDTTESCRCGCLYKEEGGRLGSTLGDDRIAIYKSI